MTLNQYPADVSAAAERAVSAWLKPDRQGEQSMADMVALAIMQDRAGRAGRVVGLTAQQRAALDFVASYTDDSGGVSPTYREIAKGIGLKSASGAHRVLHGLLERGHLAALPSKARSLAIVDRRAA